MSFHSSLVVVTVLLLPGCSADPEQFAERFVTDAERRFSVEYLMLLQQSAVDSAYAQLVPELQNAETRAQLEIVSSILSDVNLDSLALVGVNVHEGAGGQRRLNLSYEVAAGNGYVLTNVATRTGSGLTRVEGASARPMAESVFGLHAFSLEGRSFKHYFWLGMAVLMFLTCLCVAVLVGLSKGMPKRWLWAAVALIAAPVFVLNWTTGGWQFRPVALVLFGAAVSTGGPATPWVLQFGVPVGAALALLRRQRWLGQKSDHQASGTAPTG